MTGVLPVFLTETYCEKLVRHAQTGPKSIFAGDSTIVAELVADAPVPESVTLRGEPGALSVMVTAAPRAPVAVGVNVTVTVQFVPAARLLGQLLLWPKSPAFAPVITMLDMLSDAEPVLLSVKLCDPLDVPTFWLPNVRLEAPRLAPGDAVELPVPPNETECGDPAAVSVIVTAALRDPAATGRNVTETLQEPKAATLVPQLLDCEKSPGFAPVIAMLEIESAIEPVLVSVKLCGVLGEPMFKPPKIRLPGLSETPAEPPPPPLPLSGTVTVVSAATTSDALRGPEEAGINAIQIVQLEPAHTRPPQLLNCEKSLALDPVIEMLEMRTYLDHDDRDPNRVTVCVALAPTLRLPKLTLEGDADTAPDEAAVVTDTETGAETLEAYVLSPE